VSCPQFPRFPTVLRTPDALSSVTSLSDPAGSLANTYTFDSFGDVTVSTGTLTNPFQYTGRDNDLKTGLHYYRARYFDPRAGGLSAKILSECGIT
jgi:hypothetical protein